MKLELPSIGRKRLKKEDHWQIGARSADCARRLVINDNIMWLKRNFTLRRSFSFRMLSYLIYVFVGAIYDLNLFTEMKAAIAISDHDCTKKMTIAN